MSLSELVPPQETAAEASLLYVTDAERGLIRKRSGKGFSYRDAAGKAVKDAATLDRIKSLVIPPAWTDVWISASPRGHLQASGRDARGRKQHLYHPRFREAREQAKFERLADFAAALPALRAAIERDRSKRGLPREKVLATIVHLLDTTLIRVGNDEYAANNGSYGLTTLLDKHAKINGAELKFIFTGKSGKTWNLKLKDRRVAKVVRATQELPGQRLFQYVDDDGAPREITSTDVNAYLREISGAEITAKEFRTWAGTVMAAAALAQCEPCESEAAAKRCVRSVIADVAQRLGNTPAICRKCYVHPRVLEAFMDGDFALPPARARKGLSREEAATLAFLKKLSAPKRARRSKAAAAAHDEQHATG